MKNSPTKLSQHEMGQGSPIAMPANPGRLSVVTEGCVVTQARESYQSSILVSFSVQFQGWSTIPPGQVPFS